MDFQKRCPKCGEDKAYSEYHKSKNTKNNLSSYCKSCTRIIGKAYKTAHAEQERRRQREYRNSERGRERQKRFALGPKGKQSRKTVREVRKAREAAALHETTEVEWATMLAFWNSRCLRCGAIDDICQDHVIPVAKMGINHITNIQPLCLSCNGIKGDSIIDYRPIEELEKLLSKIAAMNLAVVDAVSQTMQ
jgi:5-methylcytosine-specific restriction endonuclease McrA